LNLMTAGQGIAHAEDSVERGALHGIQLWVALPGAAADVAPAFSHHADLPSLVDGPATTRVLMGTMAGATSSAHAYPPLLRAEISFGAEGRIVIPLEPDFEHAILVTQGSADVDGSALDSGPLLYLGTGRSSLTLAGGPGARLLLLGGEPFAEEIIMWW